MRYKLIVGVKNWNELRTHLLCDSNEHLAFLLARHAGERLLVRDLILVSDEELDWGSGCLGLSLTLTSLLRIMNEANRRQLTLVEAHSHPFSKGKVTFSTIDLEGQKDLANHISETMPNRPYAALVLGQDAVAGDVWLPGMDKSLQLENISVIGDIVEQWPGNGNSVQAVGKNGDDQYNRQVLALGRKGQSSIQQIVVGIVGLGGIGSIVCQELAHLGVRHFILIDDDKVEDSNLHRLVGGSRASVGKSKIKVARTLIKIINPEARVEIVAENIRAVTSLAAIKGADVIFGCVDTDSGRMILTELASAYLIPYIDSGVGILVEHGRIVEAGGRVVVWAPGRPCLLCCREIIPRIAAEELESQEEKEFRRSHGYVEGAEINEPAVISLNGTVASLAVTEFLALVTGFRDSFHYTYYDMLGGRTGQRMVKRDIRCPACSLEGVGDLANLERYSRLGLPADIPNPR